MRLHQILWLCAAIGCGLAVGNTRAGAQELNFSTPLFLPGDAVFDAAAGHQVTADIARGGNQLLTVWSDYRTSPDNYWPFETAGSGADIYGIRLDAAGNPLGSGPLIINQDFGDQVDPVVAWNGENWLVVWHGPLDSYNDSQLQAVRISPGGVILDAQPIVLHDSDYEFVGLRVAGGAGGWIVLVQSSGAGDSALRAFAIAGDGSVPIAGGAIIHNTDFLIDFDLEFAGDEYLIIWEGSFDAPRGRLYNQSLNPLGAQFALPFAGRVASDGTDFLVVWASGSPPLASIESVLVTHQGTLAGPPVTVFVQSDGQAGTCCAQVAWDGAHYWANWGGVSFARITDDGRTIVDPGGFQIAAESAAYITPTITDAPNGGVQLVWNDGSNGAAYPKDVYTGQIAGPAVLENETVVSTGAPAQMGPDFAQGDGIHVVVFASQVSGSARIMAQRINDDGVALDPEPIEVASGPVPGLGLPNLGRPNAAWNGDLFMITWSDGLQIYARRMLTDGTLVDPEPLTIMDGFDPDVAAVGSVFLVVGIDFLNGNPQWQATHSMRVAGATGQNLDASRNALGGFVIFAQRPKVVGWGDRWLATWQTNLSHDNSIAGTKGAIIDADGTTPGVFTVGLGWDPDVAVSDDRALFVAVSHTVASAHADIEGRVMLAHGSFPDNYFLISGAADKQLNPTATWNGSEFVVSWEDKRNSEIYFDERTDIYGARISPAGTVLDPQGIAFANAEIPEMMPEMMSIGARTLLATATFNPAAELCPYRIGIQVHDDDAGGPQGDLNADMVVNATDLAMLLGNWGPCPSCTADLNQDDAVNAGDLSMLLGNWTP